VTGALSPGQFAAGALLLAVTLRCCGGFAWLVLRAKLDHLTRAPRAVAFAVLLIAGLLAVELVPLVLGVLTRGTVVLAAIALLTGTFWLMGRPPRRARAPSAPLPSTNGLLSLEGAHWLLAGAGAVLTAAWCLAYVQANATAHVNSVDVLAFHLPGVIRFIQTGTIWQTTQYLTGQAQGNYPQFGDLLLLAVVLPWHSVAFIRFVDPLLLALAAVSIYGISRELQVRPATSALIACAVLSIRPALGTALVDVLTDPAFLATFSAGVLFLLRHWRTRRRSELVLAGLALGIALGTKWYGLTEIPALIAVWIVAGALARRARREVALDAGVLIGVIALAGGIWMLRNLILTGNPVFDYPVRLLGLTVFPAPSSPIRSLLGFSLAHYLTNSSVLRGYVWPEFRDEFGLVGGLLVAGAVQRLRCGSPTGAARARAWIRGSRCWPRVRSRWRSCT
jgi:Dolichyl-phosphate-mannose-protein mannosyltransferase